MCSCVQYSIWGDDRTDSILALFKSSEESLESLPSNLEVKNSYRDSLVSTKEAGETMKSTEGIEENKKNLKKVQISHFQNPNNITSCCYFIQELMPTQSLKINAPAVQIYLNKI
jgi:hypothetical protein